ncbi:hypothetical protein [Streptomyces longispororuber]|uniref:hypothetical protein n=1 Tax=Streptomyces longispororuber TaxID=68230 RepID=UPI0036F62490
MIRILTKSRLERLLGQVRTAREVSSAVNAASARHFRELYAAAGRTERAEATAAEVGEILSGALQELAAAQQELLLKDIAIRRLRAELEGGALEGRALTVLMHYGEPHSVYASREDAHADTAAHGVAPERWVTGGERPAREVRWRCEAFIFDARANGFRRACAPSAAAVGGAA